jgi:hypothetical protein
MNTKTILSLVLGLGMTFSLSKGQSCTVQASSITQDFTGMSHGSRPVCWVAHHPIIAGETFSGVYNGDLEYHIHWSNMGGATGGVPQSFIVAMQRCTVKGPLSFRLKQYPNAATLPFEVGTMSDPNNPTTFTSFQTINHYSSTGANFTVDLTGYVGTHEYIAFRAHLTRGSGFSFDNIVWSGPPPIVTPPIIILPPKGPN